MTRFNLHDNFNWKAVRSIYQPRNSKRKHWLAIFLLNCMACMFFNLPVMAKEILIPLQQLTSHSALKLRCIADEQSIMIPISERWDIKKVTLDLNYISSITMIGDHSQLTIKINDVPIGQTKLNPLAPDVILSINVPVQYLKPGYNKLSFAVSQHFSMKGCESPCAPDLWTHINIRNSSLQVEYERNPVPLKVASIAKFIFDPKIYPESRVNIITEDHSPENLTLAAIVASGVARRFDYRKVSFEVSHHIKSGMDNIVIGRTGYMHQFLQPYPFSINEINGGYLKIFPLPEVDGIDSTHALIVLSGESFDHVKLAALTFSNISFAYPGTQELNAFEFQVPDLTPYSGRDVITANKVYDFRTLNFPTSTFRGMNPSVKEVSFRLPADMMMRHNYAAKLSLNFSYGSGMRETSALNILVNDIMVRAISLNNKNGDYLQEYQLDLPTYLFRPGANVITFAPELHPDLKECDLLLSNLFISIFENSTLTFPDMPHFVELPKLELLMLNGFPFTRWPDGYDSLIYLIDASNESITAALNLVGMMTQKNGFPMLSIQIGLKSPEAWKGDLIIIGDPSKLPAELKESSPLHIGSSASLIPYPVIRSWEKEAATLSFSRQMSSFGESNGLIMQFESPYQKGRTVMILAAETPATLLNLSEALLDSEVQAQISGDMVLVEMAYPKPKVTSMEVGKKYTSGKKGDVSRIDSFLYAYPYAYYALTGLLILGFALTAYSLLKRFRIRRKLTGMHHEK